MAGVRRKQVTNEQYLFKLVHYIHANPVHHGFVDHLEDWPFSSYQPLLGSADRYLEREHVLNWFGGAEQYEAAHRAPVDDRLVSRMEMN